MSGGLRSTLFELLDDNPVPSRARRVAAIVPMLAVALAVGAALFDTLPDLSANSRWLIRLAALAAALVLAAEYAARLSIAPARDAEGARRPGIARLRYTRSFLGIIDLVAPIGCLGVALAALPPSLANFVALLALFKLARYTPGLGLVATVFRNEWRSLFAALTVLLVLLVLVSGGMYLIEREAQPAVFTSMPHALWWGITTIASVGYGDMIPITPGGRIFGGLVILLGIASFALPAGILATGFGAELRKRDFAVTWNLVARVPLFAGLDAMSIAAISRLLKPQFVPERYVVVRRGDPADAMYFILSGELEVEIVPPVRLRAGQFFGEIALLTDKERTATVNAVTESHLLALQTGDFRRLMHQHPDLEAAIRKIADSRRS
ncbi:MAG: cyclic nucleotide-gated ion channel [Dongiaceae bacterium]